MPERIEGPETVKDAAQDVNRPPQGGDAGAGATADYAQGAEIGGEAFGVIRELGDWGGGTIITETGLAKLLHRHPTSIKRAVLRGELPPPARWFGQNTWTLRSLLDHLEGLLCAARKAREAMQRRAQALKP